MKNNIKIPLLLVGGAIVGNIVSPLSNKVINNALIKKVNYEASEFQKSLNVKQNLIYNRFISRVKDLEKFGESGDVHESIKGEIYLLKKELESTLSRDQIKHYKELEKLNTSLSKRLGYANNASVALGAMAALSLAFINKK